MSRNNLLKLRSFGVQQENARVVDSNALAAKRLEALTILMQQQAKEKEQAAAAASSEEDGAQEEGDGFQSLQSNVIKAADPEALERKALEEANAMLAEAQTKAEKIVEDAERERGQVLAQAKEQGYAEGQEQARRELEKELAKLQERARQMEEEYGALVAKLEPDMVEELTGIYEYIFQVDLSANREILEYLITSAMSRSENSRSFLVHVSKEDHPFVGAHRQHLQSAAGAEATVEVIEDMTLSRNECMIETDYGIIDCGLGTELKELARKLKLLSYQSR